MQALATLCIALGLTAVVFAAPALVAARDGDAPVAVQHAASPSSVSAPAGTAHPTALATRGASSASDHEGFISRTFQLAIADPRGAIASPAFQNCIVVSMNGTAAQLTGGAIRINPHTVVSGRTIEMEFLSSEIDTVTPGSLPMSLYTPGALVAKHHSVEIIVRPPGNDSAPWVGTLDATLGLEYNGHEPKVEAGGC